MLWASHKKTGILLAADVEWLMGDGSIEPDSPRGKIPSCTQKKDQSELLRGTQHAQRL